MYVKIISMICIVLIFGLTLTIYIKVDKWKENFSDKGSITCAYSLNGSNTLYCNDWLKSYRSGKLCDTSDGCNPNSFGKVCCKNALKCCNQIATCNEGNDCNNPKYTPTKENNLQYDENIYMDQ